MPDFPVEKLLVGRWITSFDIRFTSTTPTQPGASLNCFHFMDDHSFELEKRRNKNGTLEPIESELETGTYTVEWHPTFAIARGEIRINSTGGGQPFSMHFLMRNRDELRWILGRPSGSTATTAPVAQGIMHRVELVKPGSGPA